MEGKNIPEVLGIFHRVSTDLASIGRKPGVLLISKQRSEIIMWWKQYQESKNAKAPVPVDIVLKLSDIQKIMINYHENEGYVLISTLNPTNMYQFLFQKADSSQLIMFIQILSIIQYKELSESPSLEAIMDFASSSYLQNEKKYKLFDINVESSAFMIPQEFNSSGFIPQRVIIIHPDMHIMSQFDIKGENHISNPVSISQFPSFNNMSEFSESVARLGLSNDDRAVLWPIILKVLPFSISSHRIVLSERVNEYCLIKEKWSSLSKAQLKGLSSIRDSFSTIKVDVKRTKAASHIEGIEEWSEMLIAILRSYTIWNQDVKYTQGLNDIGSTILSIFYPTLGKLYSKIEIESLAFWCYASFIDIIGGGIVADNIMEMQQRELSKVYSIIEKFHPACSHWIQANSLSDLSFLISSFMLAFGRSFSYFNVLRLWESLITVENPSSFLFHFSASLMILCYPSFHLIPNCSSGRLASVLDDIINKQDIGIAIGIALSIMKQNKIPFENSMSFTKKSINSKTFPHQLTKYKLFDPIMDHAKCYSKYGDLFV